MYRCNALGRSRNGQDSPMGSKGSPLMTTKLPFSKGSSSHKQNRIKIKIKRISSDLKPFVVTMNKISQDDKRLLTSHYIKGKSVNEIAKELDLSVTATRSRFNKAEIKFLKIYKHYSEAH